MFSEQQLHVQRNRHQVPACFQREIQEQQLWFLQRPADSRAQTGQCLAAIVTYVNRPVRGRNGCNMKTIYSMVQIAVAVVCTWEWEVVRPEALLSKRGAGFIFAVDLLTHVINWSNQILRHMRQGRFYRDKEVPPRRFAAEVGKAAVNALEKMIETSVGNDVDMPDHLARLQAKQEALEKLRRWCEITILREADTIVPSFALSAARILKPRLVPTQPQVAALLRQAQRSSVTGQGEFVFLP